MPVQFFKAALPFGCRRLCLLKAFPGGADSSVLFLLLQADPFLFTLQGVLFFKQSTAASGEPFFLLLQLLQGSLQSLLPSLCPVDLLLLLLNLSAVRILFFLLQVPAEFPAVLLFPGERLAFRFQLPGAPFFFIVEPVNGCRQLLQAAPVLIDLLPVAAFTLTEQAQLVFLLLHLPENMVYLLLQTLVAAPFFLLQQFKPLQLLLQRGAVGRRFSQGGGNPEQLTLHFGQLPPGAAQLVGIELFFSLPKPPLQLLVARGGLSLPGKRLHLCFQFKNQILDPDQVLPGLIETPLCFAFAQLVLEHAGRLFKYFPAVLGPAVDDLFHPALPHNGVDLQAGAGIQKQLGDIFEPAGGAVEQVLALAGAVNSPGNGDLLVIEV